LWNQGNDGSVERALTYFTEAIEEDPGFALAHIGIADVWNFRDWYNLLAPAITFPQARTAVAEALAIDPNLAPRMRREPPSGSNSITIGRPPGRTTSERSNWIPVTRSGITGTAGTCRRWGTGSARTRAIVADHQ
jgi:hypothetical protein